MRRTTALAVLALPALCATALLASGPANPTGPAPTATAGLTADQALRLLQEGNERFASGHAQFPNTDSHRRSETSAYGQHPFAVILACSDSRAPVEELFDRGVGDLFVVRVAGNVCQTGEAASIEYGLGHLKAPLLVVMGHSGCGAVTAVATSAQTEGNIPRLLESIRPAVQKAQAANPDASGAEIVPDAIKANVWQSVEDLIRTSAPTRELLAKGKTRIVGAVYDLNSGEVKWLGEHPAQGKILAAAAAANPASASASADPALTDHGKQH